MVIKINKLLDEDAYRGDLLRRSRYQSKKRYNKRLNYKVSDFRGLDLQKLFENNKFVYNTPIKNYVCTIAFDNPLDNIKKYVKNTKNVNDITLQMLIKALIWAYNNEKVQVNCTCPDFRYRYKYWATRGGYNYGTKETRPANITNPNNNIGAVCKHLDLLLSNENWIGKTASVLNQFIRAYPEKATYYLYDNPEDKLLTPKRDEEIPDEEEDEVEIPETEDGADIDVEEAPEEDTENNQENEDSENG